VVLKRNVEGVLWALSIGSLFLAALTSSRPLLLALALVWFASGVTVIPLHFYRAWRKWPKVPNRRQYALWVGFETLATATLIVLGVCLVLSK